MNVLVIGTGFGSQVMAPAYRVLGAQVDVASARDDAAIAAALDGSDLSLVSVHSPPFLHHQHVMAALDRRIPALCDKPFGLNPGEGQAMFERARTLRLPHFTNFELRFAPARRQVRALVRGGVIGRLQHVSWTMFGNGLRTKRYGWLNEADRGGGWIGAHGAHCIDALRWITGSEVADCGGVARIDVPQRIDVGGLSHDCTAEDAFSAWFRLDDDCTAALDTGFSTAAALGERVLLLGSSGVIELIDDRSVRLMRPGEPDTTCDFAHDPADPFAKPLRDWLSRVLAAVRDGDGGHGGPDFADGFAVASTICALARAMRPVVLPPSTTTPNNRMSHDA